MSHPDPIRSEAAVLQANASFYRVFTAGDFPAMARLWASQTQISCIHPGGGAIVGRSRVLETWREILQQPPGYVMRADHARAQLLGEVAIVLCYEGNDDQPSHLAATNVFVLEDGAWRIIHHQAGPMARPIAMPVPDNQSN
jgi:hypothetical protein